MQPIGIPSRSLKFAIDFLARRIAGFWPRDGREVGDSGVHQLGVVASLTHAHVEHDLLQAWHLHHVGVAELLLQSRHDLLVVPLLHTRHVSFGCCFRLSRQPYVSSLSRWPPRLGSSLKRMNLSLVAFTHQEDPLPVSKTST
jgi:hypothetical protein